MFRIDMKINTVLLIVLTLLVSSKSLAKVGDVYFCNKLQSVYLDENSSENTTKKNKTFFKNTFKFKRNEKEIKFDNFGSSIKKLSYTPYIANGVANEVFWSNDNYLYGFNYNRGVMSFIKFGTRDYIVSAFYRCSIF